MGLQDKPQIVMNQYREELKKQRKGKHKMLRWLMIPLVLIVIVAGYLLYVVLSYHRLPDNLTLEVNWNGNLSADESASSLKTGEYYWIMTYNIGFGAYMQDYSFFMDGGESSRAKDEESVLAAISGIGDIVNSANPDFVLMQEVDTDGTRSYHVNEAELLNEFVNGYYYTFAQNYDSAYLFYPIQEPHGANKSGLLTYSRGEITDAMRRSLPVSETYTKILDLDRCYSINRIPVENGKSLCLYNVHLSAYGVDSSIREAQLAMLYADMENDYKKGNYVVCGGDFNRNMKQNEKDALQADWASPFDRSTLPNGFRLAIDSASEEDIAHNTVRDSSEPYTEGETQTVTLDSFIVSANVGINYYANMNWSYEFSDHDPVLMQFQLRKY